MVSCIFQQVLFSVPAEVEDFKSLVKTGLVRITWVQYVIDFREAKFALKSDGIEGMSFILFYHLHN